MTERGRAACMKKASKIPAKAGTTILALAGFEFWVMRGFRSGLKPELRTQNRRGAGDAGRERVTREAGATGTVALRMLLSRASRR